MASSWPAFRPITGAGRGGDHDRMSGLPSPPQKPPGYPAEYEHELRLRDGRWVVIRPVVPDDAAELAQAIRTADPETLRLRFLTGPPTVTPALAARLTTVDYMRRFALVAAERRTGRGVAIARYGAVRDGVADVAVAVDAAWRRVGLATALIELLAQAALDRGIGEFSAYYLAENRPVAALLARAGGAGKQLIHEGIAEVSVALDRAKVQVAVQALGGTFGPVSIPEAGPRIDGQGDRRSLRWTAS
jgi:RimJ/RimL family protein N-acetyltransferase